jgi:hypothetical protein
VLEKKDERRHLLTRKVGNSARAFGPWAENPARQKLTVQSDANALNLKLSAALGNVVISILSLIHLTTTKNLS